MLTPRKLEKISGHPATVTRSADNREFTAWCVCDCARGAAKIEAVAFTEQLALERLRYLVLQEHGRIVMDRQDWACLECGRVLPLHADHIEMRSHGRDDRITNLRALCAADHEKRHRAPREGINQYE